MSSPDAAIIDETCGLGGKRPTNETPFIILSGTVCDIRANIA